MKKATRVFAAMVLIAGLLGAGCGKTDKPEPEVVDQPEAAAATNWAPEIAGQPGGHDDHDGHDHDVNDGQDHSGHNH